MKMEFTAGLRSAGALLWCIGFFFVVFDLIGIDFAGLHIPFCFLFFLLAGALCFWAEKREFSLRFALYRWHDLAMYTPWRFLLLYFLWINLFAPFTAMPFRSVLYAIGGWTCLVTVGFSAQFLFCERSPSRPVVLLRDRLQMLFWAFALSIIVGIASLALEYWKPDRFPPLMGDQANFLLILVLGLPFLLWDFLLHRRNLLPRWLSFVLSVFVVATLAVTDRKIFWLGLALAIGLVLALRLYKRMRSRQALAISALLGITAVAVAAFAFRLPFLGAEQAALEARLQVSLVDALRVAMEHRWLGTGIALSPNRNGVWAQILAEVGVVGALLYAGFLLNLLRDLYWIGRARRIIVSNIGLVSFVIFLVLVSHYFSNAYAPAIWAWYAIWCLLASSNLKKEAAR